MLGIGLCDYSWRQPNSIRAVKRLGREGALLGLAARSLCERVHSKHLFSVFGHPLNTVIIREIEARGAELGSNQPASQHCHKASRYLKKTQVSGPVNLGICSKPTNIGPLVLYGRPWLGPIHASRNGQNWTSFSTARPFRALEWTSSFSNRPNR